MTQSFKYLPRATEPREVPLRQREPAPLSPLAERLREVLPELRREAERRRLDQLAVERRTGRSELAAEPVQNEDEPWSLQSPSETKKHPSMPVKLSTSCAACGCRRDLHCLETPRLHFTRDNAVFMCLTEHCEGQRRVPGTNDFERCTCTGFRLAGRKLKLKKPKAHALTPCACCGCPKQHHCHKQHRAPDAYSGFFVDGVPYQCSHYVFHNPPQPVYYRCDSGHCATFNEITGKVLFLH